MHEIDLFIVACEPSADLLGASLLEQIKKNHTDLKVAGVFGPQMRKFGFLEILPMEDFSIMGFFEVIRNFPKLLQKFFLLRKNLLQLAPKQVLFIDYPGLNLRLQKSLRKKGFKGQLFHFVSPSVWAWGKKRIHTLAANVDRLFTLFPFEEKYYKNTSLQVNYVGHPLIESIGSYPYSIDLQKKYHLEEGKPILSIFPGSRFHEIEKNLPLQFKVAKKIKRFYPDTLIAISYTNEKMLSWIKKKIGHNAVFFPSEENYEWMKKSQLAFATSGTVTLELALHECPSIVTYAIRKVDVFLAQKIFRINLPFYCLVNLLLQEEVFPELFGPNFKEDNLFFHAKNLFAKNSLRQRQKGLCRKVKRSFEGKSPSQEIMKILLT